MFALVAAIVLSTSPADRVVPYTPPAEPVLEQSISSPLKTFAYAMATGRIIIGLAPIVAPEQTLELFDFPGEHDNASARLFGRLFGTRDIGLGAVVIAAAARDRKALRRSFLYNAAIDFMDALVISIPLIGREGIDAGAGRSLGFALGGMVLWTVGWIWATYW